MHNNSEINRTNSRNYWKPKTETGKQNSKHFFLEKTADTLGSTSEELALQVAAAFDRFKKEAVQVGESHFTQLFGALSQSLKDKFLDRDEDLGEKNLEEF